MRLVYPGDERRRKNGIIPTCDKCHSPNRHLAVLSAEMLRILVRVQLCERVCEIAPAGRHGGAADACYRGLFVARYCSLCATAVRWCDPWWCAAGAHCCPAGQQRSVGERAGTAVALAAASREAQASAAHCRAVALRVWSNWACFFNEGPWQGTCSQLRSHIHSIRTGCFPTSSNRAQQAMTGGLREPSPRPWWPRQGACASCWEPHR